MPVMRRYLSQVRPIAHGAVDPSAPREAAGSGHPYAVGRRYETAVAGVLKRRGWYTHRAYGSKGVIDLFAFRKGDPNLWIQCKATGRVDSTEWNAVYELATRFGCVPVIAFRVGPGEHAFMRLDAARVPRAQGRPWTRIDPADLAIVPLQLSIAA